MIALAGTVVTSGPLYLSLRKSRKAVAAQSDAIPGAVSGAIDTALAPMTARLDEISRDIAHIRERVAVHDDRWTWSPPPRLAERRDSERSSDS
ncbi:hypothetical protein NLX83_13145 [Allokutzneria sp. A3M-2-11 16]|uniref:hypothetical protein n=1 Tax=Allokutzneria sp. A3M-2-11 16 TaxID=2962043 RepID=UPI0020B72AC4|nr:hypothetical protein [Allokutzneria sp. A3M-2-11 16]MCP3800205.1 hypothetical protein [Allokutzneria sp. A3M-2-11 16]